MKERKIKVIKGLIIAALLSGGYAFLCFKGFAIPCVFRLITGLRCPGCGMTHMCLHLMKFEFKEAFMENQALFVIMPVLVIMLICTVIRYVKTGRLYTLRRESYAYMGMIAVLIPFAVIRNIFGF